jgi:hypothetical protein
MQNSFVKAKSLREKWGGAKPSEQIRVIQQRAKPLQVNIKKILEEISEEVDD